MMLRAGVWAFAGQGGHQFVNFALVIILARLLTPEAFGIVAAAQVILVLSQVVVKFGLGAALIQTEVLTRSMERTALTLMLGLALVMALAIYLATPWLARLMNVPNLIEIMPVMLITFLLSAATNPSMNLLMRDMRFKLIAALEIGTFALIHAVVAVALALAGWSYWALILATLASTVVRASLVYWVRPVLPTLSMRRDEVRALLGFGSGVFLAQVGSNAAQRIDNAIVASFFGPAALGFYSRAYDILDLTNSMFGGVFRNVLFSGFSKKRRNTGKKRDELERSFLSAHAFAAFVILPISASSVVLAPELVSILLGGQWVPAVPLLQVLGLGMYFRLAYKVSHSFNLAEGRVYGTAWRTLVYAVLVGVCAGIGGHFGGLVGVGYGVLVALASVFILLTHLALSIVVLPAWRFAQCIMPFLTASVLSGGLSWWAADRLRYAEAAAPVVLFVTLAMVGLSYFAALWLMRNASSVSGLWSQGYGLLMKSRPPREAAK